MRRASPRRGARRRRLRAAARLDPGRRLVSVSRVSQPVRVSFNLPACGYLSSPHSRHDTRACRALAAHPATASIASWVAAHPAAAVILDTREGRDNCDMTTDTSGVTTAT